MTIRKVLTEHITIFGNAEFWDKQLLMLFRQVGSVRKIEPWKIKPWTLIQYRGNPLKLGTKVFYYLEEFLAHDNGLTRTQDGKNEIQTWPYTVIHLQTVGDRATLRNLFQSPSEVMMANIKKEISKIDQQRRIPTVYFQN